MLLNNEWVKNEIREEIKKFLETNDNDLTENQDGGVGRHTVPPRTTRTDRKSNGKEVR